MQRIAARGAARWIICAALLIGNGLANAHLLNMTEVGLSVDPQTGAATLRLQIDLLRTAGSPEAYLALARDLNHPEHQPLWQALAEGIRLQQDDTVWRMRFVSATPPDPFKPDEFTDAFRWPRVWVELGSEDYDPRKPLRATFTSAFIFEEPIALTVTDGTTRMSRWLVTDQTSPAYYGTSNITAPPITLTDRLGWFGQALGAGFRHILPSGFDHLMLVLAVLLLCTTIRQTLVLVTAFTIGHSVSLAIAGFKLVSVPANIVEPLILLSITAYGIQAFLKQDSTSNHHAWAVMAVGLLHGLGFAVAFAELDWVQSPLVVLLGFNLGIELAQLLFVVIAFPVLRRYRATLKKPLALVLAISPLFLLARFA